MRSLTVRGSKIEFESKSNTSGEMLSRALESLAPQIGIKIKRIKSGISYKDFYMCFYNSTDANRFANVVQSMVRESSTAAPAMKANQGKTVSHKENGKSFFDRLGNLGNFISGLAEDGLGYLNNKTDSAEAAAIAQAEAAQATAEAEAKRQTTLYIGIGAGVLVLILVLILAMRK